MQAGAGKPTDSKPRGIVQGAPEPLARGGGDQQSVRVMHLRPKIIERPRAGLSEQEHAGHGREGNFRTSRRAKRAPVTWIRVGEPGRRSNSKAPVRLGLSRRPYRTRTSLPGSGLTSQHSRRAGNFLPPVGAGVDRHAPRRGAVELTASRRSKVTAPRKAANS